MSTEPTPAQKPAAKPADEPGEKPKRSAGGLAFAAAVTVMLGSAYLDHRAISEQRDTARAVAHTHEVLARLDGLLVALLDAETSRRGFSITGDELMLAPSRDAADRASRSLQDLRVLTAGTPQHRERLRALDAMVEARIGNLEGSIARRRQGFDEATEARRTAEGNALMKAARDTIDNLAREERVLLARREEQTAASVDRSRTIQTVGSALSLGLFFLAVFGLRRQVRLREQTEAILREQETELHRANAFLDSLIDNIPSMIFVKDAKDLSFVLFNRAGEDLIGHKRAQMLGKSDFDFFPREEAEAFVEKDRETLDGKVTVDIDEEPLTTEAGTRWLHTKKVPVLDAHGRPAFLLGISEDITERRVAELALREARDHAERVNRELEAFSYSVAHDLRAPLRSIDGFSQALLEDNGHQLDDGGKAHLARVRAAARRMGDLIDDLLLLARTTRSDIVRSNVDVTAVATEIGEALREAKYPKTTFAVESDLTAHADPRLIRILLENLLSNAFKFSGSTEGATVEVGRTRAAPGDGEDGPAFFVKDNGAGFDRPAAKKLFSAFQRYHRPTEYEGTGIGLATAERIVSRHGGRIWADSAPGAGATFFFTLQATAPHQP